MFLLLKKLKIYIIVIPFNSGRIRYNILNKMPSVVYRKNLNSDQLVIPNKLNIFTYILPNTLATLEKLPEDHFVICVGYKVGLYDKLQIGLTGTLKDGETPLESVKRECVEEVGFMPKDKQPDFVTTYKKILKKKETDITVSIFSIPISDCEIQTETEAETDKDIVNISQNSKRKDDKTNKIVALIHGNYNSLKPVFKKLSIPENNSDKITHHVMIQVRELKKICSIINNNPYGKDSISWFPNNIGRG